VEKLIWNNNFANIDMLAKRKLTTITSSRHCSVIQIAGLTLVHYFHVLGLKSIFVKRVLRNRFLRF